MCDHLGDGFVGLVDVVGLEKPRVQVDVRLDRVEPAGLGREGWKPPAGMGLGGRVRVGHVDVDPALDDVDATFLLRDGKLAVRLTG